jgi:hypothetical protein
MNSTEKYMKLKPHERYSKNRVLVTSDGEEIGPVILFRKRPPAPKAVFVDDDKPGRLQPTLQR